MGHAYASYFNKTYIICYRIMSKKITVSFPSITPLKLNKIPRNQETGSFSNIGIKVSVGKLLYTNHMKLASTFAFGDKTWVGTHILTHITDKK